MPPASSTESVLFAVTYAVVRCLHLGLYAEASRRGRAAWSAIVGFGLTVLIGMVLLIVGAELGGGARIGLWTAAVAIDFAGPGWLTRGRLRQLQRVAVSHFAERYSLFIIICLGESIVAIGLGASTTHSRFPADLVAVVSLGLVTTIGMWWTYFDRLAGAAEAALRTHRDPVIAASDAYSYLHLVLVAGIIVFAAGIRFLVRDVTVAPSAAVRLAVCGGVAAYLLGAVLFGMRLGRPVSYPKVAVAGALLVLFALGGSLQAWSLTAVIAGLMAVLCVAEALPERRVVST